MAAWVARAEVFLRSQEGKGFEEVNSLVRGGRRKEGKRTRKKWSAAVLRGHALTGVVLSNRAF